jgi:hypothetical protein
VTINLNDDYDGGDLRFPEFGSRTYRAEPGGAVIFSCSLLHEATPVTRGRRYATLPFLYDDAAAKSRDANNAFLAEDVDKYAGARVRDRNHPTDQAIAPVGWNQTAAGCLPRSRSCPAFRSVTVWKWWKAVMARLRPFRRSCEDAATCPRHNQQPPPCWAIAGQI